MTNSAAPSLAKIGFSVKAHEYDGLMAKSMITLDFSQTTLPSPTEAEAQTEQNIPEEDERTLCLLLFTIGIVPAVGRSRIVKARVDLETHTLEIVVMRFLVEDVSRLITQYCNTLGVSLK